MTRKWIKVGCYVMPSYSIHLPILYGKQIKTNLSCLKILLNKEHIDGTDTSAGRGVFLEDCRIFYSLDNLLLYQLGWNIYGYRRSLSGNVWKLILHISTFFLSSPLLFYNTNKKKNSNLHLYAYERPKYNKDKYDPPNYKMNAFGWQIINLLNADTLWTCYTWQVRFWKSCSQHLISKNVNDILPLRILEILNTNEWLLFFSSLLGSTSMSTSLLLNSQ